jgi:hypothetical protein
VHVAARAQTHFLNNVLIGHRAHLANGFTSQIPGVGLAAPSPATCTCKDCQAATSPLAYLADLLDYVPAHVFRDDQPKDQAAVNLKFLTDTFHQPFGDLPASCESMEEQVPQVRIGIEVLRSYLKAKPPPSDRQAALAQAETAYRAAAYTTLLNKIGTSYEEIRAARTLNKEARQALADRVGVDRVTFGIDPLDALFLDPTAVAPQPRAITETMLEKLFGLVDTTRNPLTDGPTPDLQTWRLQHLRSLWRAQDHPDEVSADKGPIIDPDVIGPADLQNPVAGDRAFDLWQARHSFVDSKLADFKFTREQTKTDFLAGFNAILTKALGVNSDTLVALDQQRTHGMDITAQLEKLSLANDAFSYLLRVRTLIDNHAPVLASEWDDVYSILVQVIKRSQFDTWRDEEQGDGKQKPTIILSPDFFKIPALPPAEFPPKEPSPLPAWRASLNARRDWQDTLQARIAQEQAVIGGLREAVSATEEATLPMLRDALIQATDAAGTDLESKADWITSYLLIDAKASGSQKTTRVGQAIETLQNLLSSLRTGQLDNIYPQLKLADDDFDAVWEWIGSYATWRAAMTVFMYPENLLDPSLRKWQTPGFRALVDDLRSNGRMTPEQARTAAQTYAAYYRDVCSLMVEASCLTRTRVRAGEGGHDGSAADERALFYMFARSAMQTVYWSAYDPQDTSGYAQTFWNVVPSLNDIVNIIGAVAYQTSNTQRCIYLFARTQDKATQKLVFIKYNLETQTWDAEPNTLELPKDQGQDTTTFTAVVKQRDDEGDSPHLAIQVRSGVIYDRQLNSGGGDWADGDWKPLLGRLRGSAFSELCAMVGNANEEFYLLARSIDGSLSYRLFGPRDDGRWRSVVSSTGLTFKGAFAWPGTADVYVFYGSTDAATIYRAIKRSNAALSSTNISSVQDLDKWLQNVSGISLGPVAAFDSTQLSRYIESITNHLLTNEITSQLASNETWNEWTLADALVKKFTVNGLSLTQVLTNIFKQTPMPVAFKSRADANELSAPNPGVTGLKRIAPSAGSLPAPSVRQVAYQLVDATDAHIEVYRSLFNRTGDALSPSATSRVVPYVTGPFEITERLSQRQLQSRRASIQSAFEANKTGPASNLTYLEEAYYFVSMHLALQLRTRGQYTCALDWFCTVYDYRVPVTQLAQRKIYYGLVQEEGLPNLSERAEDWLLDSLNPHTIAATRAESYTHFTLLSLIGCFLDFADAQFTRDTAESVPQARTLYMTALDLLELPQIKQQSGQCEDVIATLDIDVSDRQWKPVIHAIKRDLARIDDVRTLTTVTNKVKKVLAGNGTAAARFAQARALVAEAQSGVPKPPTLATVLKENADMRSKLHAALLAEPAMARATERVGAAAGQAFLHTAASISGVGPTGTVSPIPIPPVPSAIYHFCIPPNPVIKALRLQAQLNLFKLRNGRNIAGMQCRLEPSTSPIDAESGLPMIGSGSQLILPGPAILHPTPYRYSVLIERSKQLVQQAAQLEAAMLSALEKRDAEYYNLLKARQDAQLARAGGRLQDLRLTEAQGGVTLAELQQDRARIQADHFQELLDKGKNGWEIANLISLGTVSAIQAVSGVASAFTGNILGGLSAIAQATASFSSAMASFERRQQEWGFQRTVALEDVRIGAQQIKLAEDHVRVAGQERLIAQMQAQHAEAVVDFLGTKFTGFELYDFMSGVLERVYSYFLQQATAMAKLAADQLAFERQEMLPPFIHADYWEAPTDNGFGGSTNGHVPDRRGLTGSARLLQDISTLDQYAFDTNKRKLQLSKTISLALMAPAEFQRFRETGILPFNTPMEMFDRDFPGHYLRLIRRVRTSVIALIPPPQGIRATLSTAGYSRVVVSDGRVFRNRPVNRDDPQSVALCSPTNATGLFELDLQSEMLLPFEGIGVDTGWELRMPKAANPFDFNAVADVLVTIEYSALDNPDYRQQVIQTLNPILSADRPFSFRHQFADQWYDLHNPDQTATPMVVRFKTVREDFPPNLEDLKIQHVVLFFARADGASFEVPVAYLRFTEQGSATPVPEPPNGGATSMDGIISTRSGNASSWTPMIGESPFGEWELSLKSDDPVKDKENKEIRDRFKNEEIEDILFVITYAGQTPPWPV